MTFLNNMKIATKILAMLLLLGAVTLGISYSGSRALRQADVRYSELVRQRLPAVVVLARARARVLTLSLSGYQALVYDGHTDMVKSAVANEDESFRDGAKQFGEAKRNLPDHEAIIADFSARFAALHGLTSKAVRLGEANRNDEAKPLLVQADALAGPLAEDVKAFSELRMTEAGKLSEELSAFSSSSATTSLVVALLTIMGGLAVSVLFARRVITGPLGELQQTMGALAGGNSHIEVPCADRGDEVGQMAKTVLVFRDAAIRLEQSQAEKAQADAIQHMVVETVGTNLATLARGDLTVAITADFPGVYSALKANFNEATSGLRNLIGSVSETAGSIQTGSNEIAQASEDLARRTEGNAASLEQTSAAIQQIDQRLKATAVAAERSVAGSEQTMAAVVDGRARTDQAVQAMARVSESAKGIDNVIEGLDKIAFQTRVLAMNAAVEAGRAGDAGRGFAVVADLVSALAMRAEEEAKHARDQLTVTQSEIASAVDAVQKVEGALTEISSAGQEATTLAHQIATDNMAQASAISQVSTAINAMDQATQQNAAMVEETSAAARNLTAEVTALTEQAGRFEVGGTRARAIAAPVPARTAPKPRPAAAYVSPVKPLPATAGGSDDAWNGF